MKYIQISDIAIVLAVASALKLLFHVASVTS